MRASEYTRVGSRWHLFQPMKFSKNEDMDGTRTVFQILDE